MPQKTMVSRQELYWQIRAVRYVKVSVMVLKEFRHSWREVVRVAVLIGWSISDFECCGTCSLR